MSSLKPIVINAGHQQVLPAGDTLLTNAATTANASLNLPEGTAPTSPVDGDVWTTSAGLFVQIGGVTEGPLGAGGTPGGSSGQVQYNNAGSFGGFTMSGDATLVTSTGVLTIGSNAITTGKIANSAVTLAKIQNAAANSVLLGSGATGSGASYSEITLGTGLAMTGTTLSVTVTAPTAANPTATAGPSAVNGSAATFMRSDAAPAVQLGSASQPGILQVDGTTITESGGVISAVGSSGFFPGSTAQITAQDSTTSTSYTDLAHVGPVVTMTTGTSVLVIGSAVMFKPSGTGFTAWISVAVSGASSIAASDAWAGLMSPSTAVNNNSISMVGIITGLTPGSNTFTMQYRLDGGPTMTFYHRGLSVFRLN